MLLTTLDNVGSTTLFKAVFINPEQVVRFLLCTPLRCPYNALTTKSLSALNICNIICLVAIYRSMTQLRKRMGCLGV